MTLGTDDFQTACCLCFFIQLDIRTTACHVGCNGNRTVNTGICNNFRFQLVELCVQHLMLNAFPAQHAGKLFGCFDRNRTYQNRLSLCMCFLDRFHDGVKLFFLCLVNRIVQVFSDNRAIGRNLHNVHSVNISKFLFLCQSGTGHAGFFLEFIKEVLECDSCQRLAFSLDLNVLFCFNCLMQTVGITASGHDTSGKFIDNQNLILFYHVVLIAVHQVVRTQGEDDIVLNLKIFGIRKVFDMEEFLNLFDTLCSQVYNLILFIYNEITVFFLLDAHDRIHLGKLANIVTAF